MKKLLIIPALMIVIHFAVGCRARMMKRPGVFVGSFTLMDKTSFADLDFMVKSDSEVIRHYKIKNGTTATDTESAGAMMERLGKGLSSGGRAASPVPLP